MATCKQKNLESIQALRGLAAMLVMLFHYGISLNLNPENKLAILLSHGWSGVDMFFVVSGFIAAYTVSIDDKGLRASIEYLIKRLIRIVPLYYLVTILSAGHSIESFIETGTSLLFIPIGGLPPDGWGPGYGGARVGQGWTLNYEMYFYLVVAISMVFGRAKWLFTTGFIALVVLTPFAFFSVPENYGFAGFYFNHQYVNLMTNPIVLEFIFGVAVFFIYKNMGNKMSLVWGGAIVASVLYFCVNLYSPFYFSSRIYAWGIPSAILIVALLKLEKMTKIKFPNAILQLGNISFSVYLLHEGVFGILSKIIKHASGNEKIYSHLSARFILFSLSIFFTVYLSTLSYKYLEKKLYTKLKQMLLPTQINNEKQPV
uniref:Acyltransferase 3 n=1 Tax=Erwinia amylovora ATCC BAA-2158 TaxID=889211 RepID=E5B9T4_ERWAM|nr:acyltransferase 3 [Erwinia amylovora ATCC BAA-2158]